MVVCICKRQCRQLNAQHLAFVMLSEAVGEVETSKNKILRLRYRFTQDDINVVFPKVDDIAEKGEETKCILMTEKK